MDLLHPLVKVKHICMRKHRIVGIKSCILGFFVEKTCVYLTQKSKPVLFVFQATQRRLTLMLFDVTLHWCNMSLTWFRRLSPSQD